MKKQFLVMAAVLITTVSIAQKNESPKPPSAEDRLKHFTEMLDKELTLSAEKKQKVLTTYKDFFAKMDQLHAKYPPPPPPPPPPAEVKDAMDKLVAEKDSKLQGVLTADQFKKLKEMEEKRHGKHGGDMPPPPPPPPAP